MVKSLINLITDFGEDYRAIVKREIFKRNHKAKIIDYGKVEDYNIWKTAHVLDTAYEKAKTDFREIFLFITDPGVGTEREHLVVQTKQDKYLVGPNNGIITYIKDEIEKVGVINVRKIGREKFSSTFHGRDIFGPAAALISSGKELEDISGFLSLEKLVFLKTTIPERVGTKIRNAQIRFNDNYGDIIFNVPVKLFAGAKAVTAYNKIWPLKSTYAYVEINKPVALTNSTGYLEFAINQGNAVKELNVKEGDITELELLYS